MTRLRWLTALLLLLVSAARADEVPYRRYTVADGLPNEDVYALAQAGDGRLYVGTPGGLGVYNGQKFRHVRVPDSISVAGVYDIAADGRAVWVATGNSRVLKVRAGQVTRVLPRLRSTERLLVRHDTLHIVGRRAYWLVPPGADRPVRQPITLTFRLPGAEEISHAAGGLQDADFGPEGSLWVLDARYGPGRLQSDGSVEFADVPRGSGPKGWWVDMRFGPNGVAFLSGRTNVYRYHPSNGSLTPVAAVDRGSDFFFHRGIVYVPSRNGVARLTRNSENGEIRALPPLDEQIGLSSIKARVMLQDHEGGVWVGTRGGLIHLFAPEVRHITQVGGTPLVYVSHFTREEQGALWVNTWGSGIVRLQPRRAQVTPRGESHWMTVRSRDGHLYGLSERGWFRRTSGGGWRRLAPSNGAVRGIVDAEGDAYFWHNRGLYLHDTDRQASPIRLFSWKASNNGPHAHTLAPNGDVILYARGVLLRGTPTGSKVSPIPFDTLAVLPDEYAGAGIRYMAFDRWGTAWLAFNHRGLVRVKTAGDMAQVHRTLLNRPMMGVTLSGDSLVFAGTRDGLYVLDQRDGTLRRRLTAADGLLATTTRSAVVYGDTLYAAHPRGLTAMPVQSVFRTPPPPNVVLTRVERGFEQIAPQAPPRFEASDRTVGFDFAATAFKNPRRLVYEYRLRPSDTTWTSTRSGFTRYVDLPPGDYRFEVRARRAGGSSGKEATYAFTIPRFFYETGWFRLFCLVVLGLGAVTVYRWRVRTLQRRRRELEQTVADRTEQLRREKQKTEEQAERLAKLDEAKNRFFANLSHEFRTPLMLILEPLSDALDGVYGEVPDRLHEQLRLMQRNARWLQRLIEQLLDLTRLEAGRMELDRQPGDLVVFTRNLVHAFAPLAERENVALRFRSATDKVRVAFDPDKLEQVLGNLISNALTYTPEGGKVCVVVSTSTSDDFPVAEILVKDTGPGLTEEELERIFDRFAQARETERAEREGLGLGLTLAKELVELHGGTLHAESEPGFGTAFTVELPTRGNGDDRTLEQEHDLDETMWTGQEKVLLGGDGSTEEERPQAAGQPETSSSPQSPTLLIVEDNADMRSYLHHRLSETYNIFEAEDGKSGLEAAREHSPDLILSDVMMPEMSGTAFCEAIRSDDSLQSIPVLLLTAKANSSDAIEGLEHGAVDYLTKPVDVDELRARINRLLTERQRLRDRFSETVQVEPMGTTTSEDNVSFLEKVLAVVEGQLDDPQFGAGDLAAEMALSQRQLTRRLKEATGETPAALIRRLRLETAAQLLDEKGGTVSETAYAVGYNSPSHFARAFRKHFGCAPSEYDAEDHRA